MDKPQLLNSTSTTHGRDARVTSAHRSGLFWGLLAYVWWGLNPLYFKLLNHVPPLTVLAHRVVWSVIFMAVVLTFIRQWRALIDAVKSKSTMVLLVGSTLMISLNWYTFIWAVSNNRVMEASLGYYINPLVAVLFGAIVLREKLRPWQMAAVAIAGLAVAVLIVHQGALPWVSLSLAVTFGVYALLRKLSKIGTVVGLTLETALLLPVAPLFMGWKMVDDSPLDLPTYGLLALAGVVTAVPLLAFAASAARLRLATVGFLQYVSPTLQFLLAVVAFGEPFHGVQVVAFVLIWLALAVYAIDAARGIPPEPVPPE